MSSLVFKIEKICTKHQCSVRSWLSAIVIFFGCISHAWEIDFSRRQVEFKKIPPAFTRLVSILLRKKGRILFHQIVEHFCQSLGLKDVQVDYQLRKLIQEGKLSMSDDDIVNL